MLSILKSAKLLANPYLQKNSRGFLSDAAPNLRSVCSNRCINSFSRSYHHTPTASQRKTVGYWLLGMSGMCFGAVVLGGITRLTESGLSIVTWHLLKERPPSSSEDWLREFERYQQFPEYKYHNQSQQVEMNMEAFRRIWYMEYIHRVWGRTLGVVYLFPAIFFYVRGYFDRGMKIRAPIFGVLIGLQGVMGWFMVKSGLKEKAAPEEIPRVSQYWLAFHMGSALILYSLFVWNSMNHLLASTQMKSFPAYRFLRLGAHHVKALVFITSISGAFVAGLDAGLVYNSWPKMADRWIPSDLISEKVRPRWRNLFENSTTVQFIHRRMAEITGLCGFGLSWIITRPRYRKLLPKRAVIFAQLLAAALLAQITLGVSTLLQQVPLYLASLHQAGSVFVLTTALGLTHALRRLPK